MNNTQYFLAVDAGTTSIKAAVFDHHGSLKGLSSSEYQLKMPRTDIVEFSAEDYWNMVVEQLRRVIAKSGLRAADPISVSISSQAETLIVVDRNGVALRNAIVWLDNRSRQEARELKREFGVDPRTGQVDLLPTWPITKILWLGRNEPSVRDRAYKYLLLEDYLIYRLTGEYVGEFSLYTSSYMLDIVSKRWMTDILEYASVDADQLVTLVEPGAKVGKITSAVAREVGLSLETTVVAGAMDQAASILGSGNVVDGATTETTGSALSVCRTLKGVDQTGNRKLPVHYHALRDRYYSIDWCPTAGMSLRWLRDLLREARRDSSSGYDELTKLVEEVPAGSGGLLFFPFLSGMGSYGPDSETHGAFLNLGLHHSRGHFVRSVMESVAYLIRYSIESLHQETDSRGAAGKVEGIRSLGGGANSARWNLIKANVTGQTVATLRCHESSSLGVAMLQAIANGNYDNFEQAVEGMVAVDSVVEPDPASVREYEPLYASYRDRMESFYLLPGRQPSVHSDPRIRG